LVFNCPTNNLVCFSNKTFFNPFKALKPTASPVLSKVTARDKRCCLN
jgi:hypothetical protein